MGKGGVPESVVAADFPYARPESLDDGRQRLEAPVERARVDPLDGRVERGRGDVSGQLAGLLHAVAGQRRVAGDAGGGGHGALVGAGARVLEPVGAELCRTGVR